MKTVVLFLASQRADQGAKRNNVLTRTLGKVGFINERGPTPAAGKPSPQELWLVEIVRENLSADGGGCFILQPLSKVEKSHTKTLLVGQYDIEIYASSAILIPHAEYDPSIFWAMSSEAKRHLRETTLTRGIVIPYGLVERNSEHWPRRRPAEDVLESELKKILPQERK